MTLRWHFCALAALAAVASAPCALAQGRVLQHDPFARPQLGFVPAAGPSAPVPKRTPPPKLKLTGVVVAGAGSMANVDGIIVRVGESIQGYRLVTVHERTAIFEKNNAHFTLSITPMQEPRLPPAAGNAK
jgi:hypothetical protein